MQMSSIMDFRWQMTANPLLFNTMGVILVNSWTDAPNAITTCVVTRCMPPKAAILPLIIRLNDIEEECDKLYLESMHKLSVEEKDVLTIVSMCKVYECFESCADAREHVGDSIGSVIMKNT